jgi:hypothetical protein
MKLRQKTMLNLIIILLVNSSLITTISSTDISSTNEPIHIANSDFDLLIITYPRYAAILEVLVEHKQQFGINTILVTTTDIYFGEYFTPDGRDIQEKIKYFIKNAMELWGISYVLLVGSYCQLPVRYSHLETDYDTIPPEIGIEARENQFISELYYADIYNQNGSFCSWDSNGNDIFGEWSRDNQSKDHVDLIPDVSLGRLACRNKIEVYNVVQKIITYETTTYESSWFNTMVVIGGDSFNDLTYGTDISEGECITQHALEYMSDFSSIKYWISNGKISTSLKWLSELLQTLKIGAGFIYFSGHCNPGAWTTHPHADFDTWIPYFRNLHVSLLFNNNRLPILIAECCHPCQFNVSLLDLDLIFRYWQIIPECWTWHMVSKIYGGSIASIGGTGYSITGIGDMDDNDIPDCIEAYDGWLNTHLFKLYANNTTDVLGDLLKKTLEDYIGIHPVYNDRHHCKVVEMKVLLGDPTLKIGGYPINHTDQTCNC